ncbi:hypothetical protein ACJMK2_037697 [Sinanodonta woodiana]|uniref:Uncharacterized protein n=1 Tax=Sinanodonta woodiana TaxID=1069815 RepID=A0ABD3WMM4_SINWO
MVETKKSEIIRDLQDTLKNLEVEKMVADLRPDDLKARSSEIATEGINRLISEWAENDEGVLQIAIADVKMKTERCLSSIRKMELECCPECKVEESINLMDFEFLEQSVESTTLATRMPLPLSASSFPLKCYFYLCIAELIYTLRNKKSKLTKLTLSTLEKISDDEYLENLISTLFERPVKNWIKKFRKTMQCEIASKHKVIQQLSADVQCAKDNQSTLVSLSHELNTCLMNLEKIGVE